ncbi:MAG TPA: zinc-dependent metalloprotease family protein [Solimonas sp.]|nr:zinc-dependent metalloprotease family protein [Solimonas sp.]
MSIHRVTIELAFLALLLPFTGAAAVLQGQDLWVETPAIAQSLQRDLAQDWIAPREARLVELQLGALDSVLAAVTGRAAGSPVTLILPRPDGGFERFRVWEDSVMAPALSAWMAAQGYPMRTFAGESLDRPGNGLRFDWGGPRGFHASVLGPADSYYLDPRWRDDVLHYVSYRREALAVRQAPFICAVDGSSALRAPTASRSFTAMRTGGARRVYRAAVAATAEYTSFHGGTKPLGQAAIVTTVNRVNQIYLRDFSVFLQLVANNQNVVYSGNVLLDPYLNDDGQTMLTQNQTNLDSVIGSANYDIGHVVSTGGGGIAALEVPCDNSAKAEGVTGSPAPVGDAFDIDYVAHEMGHQFGGNHTFNSETGSCGGGNREPGAAYEPGSGSTIMAYAGICDANDLQPNSDALFHYKSLDEILNFTAGSGAFSTTGNSCSTKVAGINSADPAVSAGPDFTIPSRTPFELTASGGTDSETGGSLTYIWEQYDLGSASNLAAGDPGNGPIARSFNVSASPVRSIPRLSTVLGQTAAAKGEALPTTSRTMTFRVTVRDNDPDGGRIGTDTMTVTSVAAAGPFAVTAPNGGESLSESTTVTWNIAGTAGGTVNTPNVDIFFSADNGQTFTPVLLNTPNDGSQQVFFPVGTNTTQARMKVKGAGNIFYDISNAVFTAVRPIDTAPDNFSFTDQTGIALGSTVQSNTVTIGGINSPAAVSISGDASARFSIAGGAFGTGGSISDGQGLQLQLTASSSPSTTVTGTVNVGGVARSWSVTTLVSGINAFSFVNENNAPAGDNRRSNIITVSGTGTNLPISISGHASARYAINAGTFTSAPGTVSVGDKVQLLMMSSPGASGTTVSATLSIDVLSAPWSVTTGPDSRPNPYSFTSQTDVGINSAVLSNTVVISGLNQLAPTSLSGDPSARISVNGGPFETSTNVPQGAKVRLRMNASPTPSTVSSVTVNMGGQTSTWTLTTAPPGVTPFSFTPVTGAASNDNRTSNFITASGMTGPAAISVSGDPSARYQINANPFTSAPGTVNAGDNVRMALISSVGPPGSTVSATLNIGGVDGRNGTFSVSTAPDTTPNPFSFAAQSNVAPSTPVTSNEVVIGAINTPVSVGLSGAPGAQYSINGGAFGTSGQVVHGSKLRVRVTSSASAATPVSVNVTVGGVSSTFTATTAP